MLLQRVMMNLKQDKLLFLPIGGCNEIGMNLSLYQYGGKWLAVDLGIGFADNSLPGIDIVVPNIDFLIDLEDDLLGIFITHAHEDHYGAIPYLWHELKCPLYMTSFTETMLKSKLDGMGVKEKLPINIVKPGDTFDIAPFSCEIVEMTHSVPEMHAIAIRAGGETIVHTGDWKLDPKPLIGPLSNESRLKEIGDEGVLALICDSTNIFVEGESGSESTVRENLIKVVGECTGRVAVATFASNVTRVESIVEAAKQNGRKVALAGFSLNRTVRAAQDTGYLEGVEFLTEDQAGKTKKDELLVICTGCQGEDRAAVTKLAEGRHKTIKFTKGDTIIFSSKIIPGNHKTVYGLYNKLVKSGIEVIEKKEGIHVSGHPAKEELTRLYELVRPQIAIPVHGEPRHIHEHARFAKEDMKVPSVIEISNGNVLDIKGLKKIGNIETTAIAIDGSSFVRINSPIIKTRKKMSISGCMSISLVVDSNNQLMSQPSITAPGLLAEGEDDNILFSLVEELEELIEKGIKKGNSIVGATRTFVRKFIKRELNKNPVIEIHVIRI